MSKIKWIILDVDGIITDGYAYINNKKDIIKRINYKDIDTLNEMCLKYNVTLITSSNDVFVNWLKDNLQTKNIYSGIENKAKLINEIIIDNKIKKDEVLYVGDGKNDVKAFDVVGIKACPLDAINTIKEKSDFIVNREGGKGFISEILKFIDNTQIYEKADIYWNKVIQEHEVLVEKLKTDFEYKNQLEISSQIIGRALNCNKKVVIFGNGGSASDAQHISAEFVGRFYKEREAFNVQALNTNTSILTAIANDYSFDYIFSRQIEATISYGDVAIGITTSGKSKNVINALRTAKRRNANTILLTSEKCEIDEFDVILKVPSSITPRIQEAHILTGHFWAEYLESILSTK